MFESAAARFMPEYDAAWLEAQGYQESRWDPLAVSPVGATGLMQIMPATGAEIARIPGVPRGPLTNPVISTFYGGLYMRRCLNAWSTPRPHKLDYLPLAWGCYNAGLGHILKAQKKCGGALLWSGIAPCLEQVTGRHSRETITYVERIHRWYGELSD